MKRDLRHAHLPLISAPERGSLEAGTPLSVRPHIPRPGRVVICKVHTAVIRAWGQRNLGYGRTSDWVGIPALKSAARVPGPTSLGAPTLENANTGTSSSRGQSPEAGSNASLAASCIEDQQARGNAASHEQPMKGFVECYREIVREGCNGSMGFGTQMPGAGAIHPICLQSGSSKARRVEGGATPRSPISRDCAAGQHRSLWRPRCDRRAIGRGARKSAA
jgi:hypothetical protein